MVSREELRAVMLEALEVVRPAYLSREQLATELDVTVKTVRRMESNGLPVHHLGGSVYRFFRSEVEAWMKANKETAA
jgi:excisionase family DNA binding protein